MSRWLKMGLTDKLFIPFVCILLITVAVSTYLSLLAQAGSDAERVTQFRTRLKEQWRATAHTLWMEGETEELSTLFRKAADLDTMLNKVTLRDTKGRIVAASHQNGTSSHSDFIVADSSIIGPNGQIGVLTAEYASRLGERTSLGLITSILVTGLVAIVLGAFVYMKVLDLVLLKRIRSASEAAAAVAGRDLGLRLDDHGEDELALLAKAFNKMADNLRDVIGGIQTVVADVDSHAAGIMASVESQSTLSTTQSEQVTRITATMTAMAEQTLRISESAHEVVEIAHETHHNSDLGVSATDDARAIMSDISSGNDERVERIVELKKRAGQVGEVMEFIEQIADQTKLIAFNASIEAAGAGEMGRRFEVVAREIRRLAENVSESAGQIRTRILDIQQAIGDLASTSVEESKKVACGAEASLHTVTVLHGIREGSNKTTRRVQEISDAIALQESASAELVRSLKGIDQNAQALKQGLSELVGIASYLKTSSSDLRRIAAGFHLTNDAITG